MNSLRRLRRFWNRFFQRPDRLSSAVAPHERLSRFILTKNYIKRTKNRVSPQAFLPSSRTGETSVYRTGRCTEEIIWEIGDTYVTGLHPEHKPVLGRGDLIAQEVFNAQIRVAPSSHPHPLHANMVGWPIEREKALMIATQLADGATPVIRPTTS